MARRKSVTEPALVPVTALVDVGPLQTLQQTLYVSNTSADPAALAFGKRSRTLEAGDSAIAIVPVYILCRTRSRTLLERVKPAIYIKILTERVRTRFKIEQVDSQ